MVVLSPDGRTRSADSGHIDLLEWAEVAGVPFPFPMPAAATAALWDEIRRVPLTQIGNEPLHERVAHVVRKAAQAFERAQRARELPTPGQPRLEPFSIDFGVHLDTGREPAWRILRLACLPAETGNLSLLVGFPAEPALLQVSPTSAPQRRHDA